jgi:hypothetical protein
VPSSGKSLKELSESVDLLFAILGPLLASILIEHPQFKKKMIADVQALRRVTRLPKNQATLDKVLGLLNKLIVIEK